MASIVFFNESTVAAISSWYFDGFFFFGASDSEKKISSPNHQALDIKLLWDMVTGLEFRLGRARFGEEQSRTRLNSVGFR
jgi:hypothetical protein